MQISSIRYDLGHFKSKDYEVLCLDSTLLGLQLTGIAEGNALVPDPIPASQKSPGELGALSPTFLN